MPICLTPHYDGDPIKLDKAILLIGRHPNCDIVLLTSRKVSRIHCCIAQAGNRLLIRDLGSTNGVTVNGEGVEESEIRPGDEVTIGDLEFFIGDGANNLQTRRAKPDEKDRQKADSAELNQFSGLDSVETPIIGEIPLAPSSDYAIVMESSQIIDKAPSHSDESSYVELNESDL